MWGLISENGSEAVFRDTRFRTVGLMFKQSDSVHVSNITNSSSHTNDVIGVPDRHLKLINSDVQTWSYYASGEVRLTIENSVFGECLSQDSSHVTINNSVCDGTGGYIGAFNKSATIVVGSMIRSQAVSRNNAFLIGAESAFMGPHINADEESIMFLANVKTVSEPEAKQSAVVFQSELFYQEGNIDSEFPLHGTARIKSGPECDIQLEGYKLHYSPAAQDPVWRTVDGMRHNPVYRGQLGIWPTHGLVAGDYALRLTLYHSWNDSVSMISRARLLAPVGLQANSGQIPKAFSLDQNYPNPFNSETLIQFFIPGIENVSLQVYNILGNLVFEKQYPMLKPGHHTLRFNGKDLPSGVYIYRVCTDELELKKRMMLYK
ncbi:MAG: T9SS type A sorting domain-containing protein [candidate division KSB1 bacterium]|nr:T9SS type A sorting domain-containing protein [candidate division KSB1 bacterium]